MGRYVPVIQGFRFWENPKRLRKGVINVTPAQKAKETRIKNKMMIEQSKQRKKRITDAIISGCLSVLEDKLSSVDQKLEASKILNEVRKGEGR